MLVLVFHVFLFSYVMICIFFGVDPSIFFPTHSFALFYVVSLTWSIPCHTRQQEKIFLKLLILKCNRIHLGAFITALV